ncbi:hypothetical protein [Streptomyces sp. NPDC001843]|uniref:hypothetical protein n=1 Tax=Streptomyces sp. NPDC001843 TaxID=3364617 RepID=UPI00368FE583
MSKSAPPPHSEPQPQPADANPFAQQPPVGAAYAPPVPPAPRKDNVALGLVAALGAALGAAALYGVVIGLTKHEIGWAAVGVGFVIGLAAGKVGGRNPALAVVGAVLALGAVYIGQLVGEAMIGAKDVGVSFSELFFQHFGLVQEAWKQDADPLTFLFFGLAAFAAFSGTKKAAA